MMGTFCSPGLAEKLKMYGAPNDSTYCWVNGILRKRDFSMNDEIPAYEDDEIFDLMPDYIDFPGTRYECEVEEIDYNVWKIYYNDGTYVMNNHSVIGITYVDTLAEMLIYLIEQELFGYD